MSLNGIRNVVKVNGKLVIENFVLSYFISFIRLGFIILQQHIVIVYTVLLVFDIVTWLISSLYWVS